MGARFEIPANVPADRVVDFDFCNVPGADLDPHLAWKRLHEGPDIVWAPYYGGHWILTRAEDIETVQKDYEHFSHRSFSLPRVNTYRFVPIEMDPPEHTPYRNILNPFFTPKSVGDLEGEARALAVELIEGFKHRGACEFVEDFAHHLPVRIFLRLAGLPLELRDRFLGWAEVMARSSTREEKIEAFTATAKYLEGIMAERIGKPGPDLYSVVANARIDGKPIEPDKIMGVYLVAFFGGLDTVAGMLSFIALFLARHPAHRRQLIDNPDIIPDAVEEFLRRFGLSNTTRIVTKDFEYKGVQFRKDDIVMVPIGLSGVDERRYPNALEVDFSRKPLHNTFGNGPHRCVGSMLARTELRVFLEEWLRRIPDFWIQPGDRPLTGTGPVNGVLRLPLVWKA